MSLPTAEEWATFFKRLVSWNGAGQGEPTALGCLRAGAKDYNHQLIQSAFKQNRNTRPRGSQSENAIVVLQATWKSIFEQLEPKNNNSALYDKPRVLEDAIENDQSGPVQVLLCEQDVDRRLGRSELPPLLLAIKRKVSRSLLLYIVEEMGADVNIADGKGRSPLAVAVEEDNLEALDLLLRRGARQNSLLDIRDSRGGVTL